MMFGMNFGKSALVGAVCLFAPSAALADFAISLGLAGEYNEFVFGDSSRTNTDSEGPVAVGGNADYTNFTVASSNGSPSGSTAPNLIVGGNLNWTNGEVQHGSGYVGGTATLNGVSAPGGTIVDGVTPLPIDFAAEQAYLLTTSTDLNGLSAQSAVKDGYYWTFGSPADAGLQVYSFNAADFANSGLRVNGSADSTVIVNVLGAAATISGQVDLLGGITASNILWNFVNAENLLLQSVGFNGSILAVNADVVFDNGQINGSVIASSLTGTGETHYHLFKSPSAVIPEPSTVVMMGTALVVGLGVFARRRSVLRV